MNVNEPYDIPVSFRVIGIGKSTEKVIEGVRALGFDCVAASVVNNPGECIPTEEDKMAIIVGAENGAVANQIARSFHDAGVLTIGLLNDADTGCFDSVLKDSSSTDYVAVIQSIVQPILTSGYICYDFNDLCTTMRDSVFFAVKITEGDTVGEAVRKMEDEFKSINIKAVENMSIHVCFNRERPNPIEVKDMATLSESISKLPETINTIWSVRFDNIQPGNRLKLVALLGGKEM